MTAATAASILEELAPLALLSSVRDDAGEIVDFRVEFANASMAEVLRERADTLIGRRLLELYPSLVSPGSASGAFNRFRDVVATARPLATELPWIDDRNLHGVLAVRAVRYGDGLLLSGRDVTAQKRTRLAHEVMAASHDGVVVTDRTLRITSWNPAAQRLYGYSAAEVEGRFASSLVPADAADEIRQKLNAALEGQRVEPFETTGVRRDGSRLDVELTIAPVRSNGDPVIGVVAVHRDITDRVEARQALLTVQREVRDTASLLQALIDTTPDALIAFDADGRILQLNRAALHNLSMPRDAVVGRRIAEILPDYGPRFERLVHEAVASGHPVRAEVEFGSDGGQSRWYEDMFAPELGPAGPTGRVVTSSRDVTTRHHAEVELATVAFRDPLTGLLNRRLLLERIQHDVARLERGNGSLAVLFIDLDGFKDVNDRLGHETGDEVLRVVARRLESTTRHGDTVARMGGDEFVVVSNEEAGGDAAVTAQRILSVLGEAIDTGGDTVRIGASIGIVIVDDPTAEPECAIADADAAMYRAKERQGNHYEFFDATLRDEIERRVTDEELLRAALAAGAIEPWFQPEVDMRSGQIVGFELLSRWRSLDGPVRPAADFMPVAEASGLVAALDLEMRRRAFAHMADWRRTTGRTVPTVWMNVARRELTEDGYADRFLETVAEAGLSPTDVGVELTEAAVRSRASAVMVNCAKLADAGVHVAVDDFGTGSASLSYLRDLRVDTLKVDGSFVANLAAGGFDGAVVTATVAFGSVLGVRVVGEAVETAAQRDALLRVGCNSGQGALFAEPVPSERVPELIAAGVSRQGGPG